MQTLLTALLVVAGLLVTAFGLGWNRGKNTAESRAAAKRASLEVETLEKHIEVLKNAVDVQQDINSLPDAAVSERLRERWRRQSN